MGYTPAEIGAMSIWEYSAVVDGYIEANSAPETMTGSEMDDIWNWMQTKEGTVH
jgi:hypothetical protein